MASTIASSARFQSILDAAFDSYAKQTGVELSKHPSADRLHKCHSFENVLQLLLEKESAFQDYRDNHRKLMDFLHPVVQVVHTFSGIFGEVAGFIPFPPTKAIFVGIDILLSAAIGVSSSYDVLLELFECIANFLKRLHIYTEKITLPSMMSDIIVQIMVEVLSVLALATKQIKEGRFKKFAKKLLGEGEVEAILQRLDRLTQEEARMTVAHTLEVVHGVFDNLKVVMADGKASTEGVRKALVTIQQTTDGINRMERNQLQRDIRVWLSPPDASINHETARGVYHDGTASWFTQSSTFKEWKSNGSLLWIYGKPGSGKSILCSSIIQDLEHLRNTGLALMTYFYFDFKDSNKQNVNGLLASCIAQLSAKSNACYKILSDLYSEYDAGSRRPGYDALRDCLTNMLNIEGHPTIYIIMDAIDECPNSPGVTPPRDRVLQLVEELVDFRLANVRICATSRPEADIRISLETLASHNVSLHDEDGQKEDISHYVRSFIYRHRNTRRWREEDKEMVINTLSQKANGMFRWIVCQIEALINTFPSAIRRALDDLPLGLDETYDRVLQGIPQARQKFARRLFACLSESIRPLRVEELAEIVAIELDAGAVPSHDMNWRPEDPEDAVLSACSSLITIVKVDGSRIVQFSHFSVKEYLTSERLANAEKLLSQYHILPHSAHIILAQASLGVLLALDDKVNKGMMKDYPFAIYAAQHLVEHAQFENVSVGIDDAMKQLFDPSKPHFAAWVWIYDMDFRSREIMSTPHPTPPGAVPLYYATLCGLRSITEHLIVTCPEDVNARGGYHTTPLHAAVYKGHIDIMALLAENGADVHALNRYERSPLHEASSKGRVEMIELLLNHHADINALGGGDTALGLASMDGELDTVRLLLRHGATADCHEDEGWNPLMSASRHGHVDIVRLLLENGATVNSRDDDGSTPLTLGSQFGHHDVVRMLLENGATVDTRDNDSWTSLMSASRYGYPDVVRILLENGATVNSCDDEGSTPLDLGSQFGHHDVVRMLLEKGATVDVRRNDQWTSLMSASRNGHLDVARILLENGAIVDSSIDNGWNSLMLASKFGHPGVVRVLLENGATVDSRDKDGWTPLDLGSHFGHPDVVRMLLEKGATVDVRRNDQWTSLMSASRNGHLDVARILLENGAIVDSSIDNGWNSLMLASKFGHPGILRVLLENGATVDSRDKDGWTPLLLASKCGHPDIVRTLLESGATVDSYNQVGWTPLQLASLWGKLEIVRLLLASGAGVNPSGNNSRTPLVEASNNGYIDVIRLLPQSGATIDSDDNDRGVPSGDEQSFSTPLHFATINGHFDVAELLVQNGANVNNRNENGNTPLSLAAHHGQLDIARLLLKSGSSVNSQDHEGSTPLHKAAENGHLDIVTLLLDRGADFNVRNSDDKTCLKVALDQGKLDVARVLMGRMGGESSQEGIDLTLLAPQTQDSLPNVAPPLPSHEKGPTIDKESGISLHTASEEGKLDVVRSLLDAGANVDDRDEDHETPLHCASRGESAEVVKLLIEHGADVNSRSRSGETPLHEVSTEDGDLEVAQLLLDHGANVDARGEEDWTPLHLASYNGHLEIVQAMLKRGANVYARNDEGRTPLDEARRGGQRDIMRLLSEYISGHGL